MDASKSLSRSAHRTAMIAMLIVTGTFSALAGPILSTRFITANRAELSADNGVLQLVDERNFRHCHNTPRRTYCHKNEQLPVRVSTATNSISLRISHVS
jgi:hypothetical protein